MIVPLGVAVSANLSLGELFDRAQSRMALIAAGQPSLRYLSSPEYIRSAHLEVSDGSFQLRTEIPIPPQKDFFGHARGPKGAGGLFQRQDDREQEAVEATLAGVQRSAHVLDYVAQTTASSSNLSPDLLAFEQREGVHTRPARRFLYAKQEGFNVDVEGDHVPFRAHVVRAAVASMEPVDVTMTLVPPRSESILVRGLIHETHGDGRLKGVQAGGTHYFRFAGLDSWQKTVLEAACALQLPLHLKAVETMSTCTLEYRPADVIHVQNWLQLLQSTIELLSASQPSPDARDLNQRSGAA